MKKVDTSRKTNLNKKQKITPGGGRNLKNKTNNTKQKEKVRETTQLERGGKKRKLKESD